MTVTVRTLQRAVVLLASAVVVGYLIDALKIVEKAERGLAQLFSFTAFTASHDDHLVVVAITKTTTGSGSGLNRLCGVSHC